LRSEVSPYGEVFWANLTSLGVAKLHWWYTNFTFAKQKLHLKNYRITDVKIFFWR
jgi:hypothetical protein